MPLLDDGTILLRGLGFQLSDEFVERLENRRVASVAVSQERFTVLLHDSGEVVTWRTTPLDKDQGQKFVLTPVELNCSREALESATE